MKKLAGERDVAPAGLGRCGQTSVSGSAWACGSQARFVIQSVVLCFVRDVSTKADEQDETGKIDKYLDNTLRDQKKWPLN